MRWRGVDGGGGGGVGAVSGAFWPVGVEGRALVKTSPSVLSSVSNSLMCKELRYDWRRLLIVSWIMRLNSCPGPGPEAAGCDRGLSMAFTFSNRGVGARSEVAFSLSLWLILLSFTDRERPIPCACELEAVGFVLKVISSPGKMSLLLSPENTLRPFWFARSVGTPKVPPPLPILSLTIPTNPPSGIRLT